MKKFTFESGGVKKIRNAEKKVIEPNKLAFAERFGVEVDNLPESEKSLIESFLKANIRNIEWYTKRIAREGFYRNVYNALTILLIIAIPLIIFFVTKWIAKKENGVIIELSGLLTALISSVLALHKLITSWVDKRKFRAHFMRAKVKLKNILYKLEDNFGVDNIQGEGDQLKLKVTLLDEAFIDALEVGLTKSREIVDEETLNYFEMQSNPGFDIAGALQSSAAATSGLLSAFKSKKLDVDYALKEQTEEREQKKENQSKSLLVEMEIQKLILKMDNKNIQLQNILVKLNALDSADSVKRDELLDNYEIVRDEINVYELQLMEKEVEHKFLLKESKDEASV